MAQTRGPRERCALRVSRHISIAHGVSPRVSKRRREIELHHPAGLRPGEWTGDIELTEAEADHVRPDRHAGTPRGRTRTGAPDLRPAPGHAAVDEGGDLDWNRPVHGTGESERAQERKPELEVGDSEPAAKQIVELRASRRQHRDA